jgi:hypothetical protein
MASPLLPHSNDKQKLVAPSRVSVESNLPNLLIRRRPVYWDDLSISNLLRFLPDLLRSQQIELKMPSLPMPSNIVQLARAQRAHRRLT